jgi:hypothetical protein
VVAHVKIDAHRQASMEIPHSDKFATPVTGMIRYDHGNLLGRSALLLLQPKETGEPGYAGVAGHEGKVHCIRRCISNDITRRLVT